MAKIELKNITKKWGDFVGVDNFNLTIPDEEFLVLLGPSGCGKTTTMRMIAGLETVTSGEVLINGEVVNNLEPKDRDVAMVFQSYALYPNMTVYENIRFPLKVRNIDKELHKEKVMRASAMVELDDFLHRKPSELSGGQRQRVALARAIVREPTVFLMDEPLSNLDARLRMDMRVELKRFQSDAGATTVYVTHDQTEAMTMSTRVVVMKDGQIQQVAAPSDLYHQPLNTFVADFIGMPRINLITLRAAKLDKSIYKNDDMSIDIGWVPGVDEIVLGAHPEDLVVSRKTTSSSEEYSVTAVLPNGPETIIQLSRGKTTVIARVAHDSTYFVGESVYVNYTINALNVYDAKSGLIIASN